MCREISGREGHSAAANQGNVTQLDIWGVLDLPNLDCDS